MAARNKLFALISLLIENQRNQKIGEKQEVDPIKSKANCMSGVGRFLDRRSGDIF
jgi:hypothetical protein